MRPSEFYALLAVIVAAPQLNTVFAWLVFVLLACFASWLGKGR